jgi:hypothetical protein
MANIKARRALDDLFSEGVEVRFGKDPETNKPKGWIGPFLDSQGDRKPCPPDQINVWVRPADPLQREMAMREANAKRARAMVKAKRDEDSEEHLTIMAFLSDMDDETLIDYVVIGDTAKRRADAEREILALEEWKEMDSYQDAMRQFEKMTDEQLANSEEWEALLELDKKFGDQILEREKELSDAQRDVLRIMLNGNRAEVERKALERRAEMTGTQAFINEYELQMLFYSLRDYDDSTQLFFESPEQLQRQHEKFRDIVSEALLPFISEAGEAKNLLGVVSGSESSELPSDPETSESSTQEELSA